MWRSGWRDQVWADMKEAWDLIIIGGGITGAGIFCEATRAGIKTLLVESRDFSSGTSSRSSKLVHGGFRYLRTPQIRLTFESVRERERLLHDAPGLVVPLDFLLVCYAQDRIPRRLFGVGLAIYDLIAFKWEHRSLGVSVVRNLCPTINPENLTGGYYYRDALTDDSRLVLQLIKQGVRQGGAAINYACVETLLRDHSGQVRGVGIKDRAPQASGQTSEAMAKVVINASGVWADELRTKLNRQRRLRKLRGSHLVFPRDKLPLDFAISVLHPQDGRPVFTIPWESVTLIGTTDVDHREDLYEEPGINASEANYLLAAVNHLFPSLEISFDDVQATYAGVRGVVDTGKATPSRESREHVLWKEDGLVTITGGKLTTFRLMALSALRSIASDISPIRNGGPNQPLLETVQYDQADIQVEPEVRYHLIARYGTEAKEILSIAKPNELEKIGPTNALWAELRWSARSEGVVHLDDLLLRRVRLGLLLPEGGIPYLDRIRAVVKPELGWDDDCWAQERNRYIDLWHSYYHLPESVQKPE